MTTKRRHICCIPGCKVWVPDEDWCCPQHRDLVGFDLYHEMRVIWLAVPRFDREKYKDCLARCQAKLQEGRSRAVASR